MPDSAAIWAIEDDPGMQLAIEEILKPLFTVRLFSNVADFRSALVAAPAGTVDLVIADLMLPERSFLNLMKSKDKSVLDSLPVIVVSSIQDLDTLRFCYEFGVKDYITKPFVGSELIAKIEKALGVIATPHASEGRIVVDSVTRTIQRQGKRSDTLTTREFRILQAIHQSAMQSLGREQLLRMVWGPTPPSAKALDVHLVNLRRKIQPLGLDVRFRRPDQFVLLSDLPDA